MRLIDLFESNSSGKVWYHATPYDFDEFVPHRWRGATYFAPTPDGAIRGAGAGGMEHPALSGPSTGRGERKGMRIIPVYVKGKIWGQDPLPLEWFPETMRYGEYKNIIANGAPIHVQGLSEAGNGYLNRIRNKLVPLIYTEDVPVEEYEKYVDDTENDLPLKRDKLPVADKIFSYKDVEGIENYIRDALRAIGFENWLVNDEGGDSLAVSNPKNIIPKFTPNHHTP